MRSKKSARKTRLLYIRLPHRISDLSNDLIYESKRIIIGRSKTYPSKPIEFDGKIVMDTGFEGAYFILDKKWFVVSKIRDIQGKHTGYYCDIVTPVNRNKKGILELTDLLLDLWVLPESQYKVLDEDEFDQALRENLITESLARKARNELRKLIKTVEDGKFPPAIVKSYEKKLTL